VRIDSVAQTERAKSKNFSGSGSSTADRLSGISRSRNSGRGRRLDLRTNLGVDVRTNLNFRPDNAGTNHSGGDSTGRHSARHNAAGNNHAWNGSANSGNCSSLTGNGDSGYYAKYDHDPNSGDDAQQHDAADNSQHSGNDPFDAEYKSKFASPGINQSSEQHSANHNTANDAFHAASGSLTFLEPQPRPASAGLFFLYSYVLAIQID